jgi:hypothetical protein
MKVADYITQDMLELRIFAGRNPIADSVSGIGPILRSIHECSGDLRPDQFTVGKKKGKFSPETVEKSLSGYRWTGQALITLTREADPPVEYALHILSPGWDVEFWMEMSVPLSHFIQAASASERVEKAVRFVRSLTEVLDLRYGLCHDGNDLELSTDATFHSPGAPKRIYEMYWLNLYGRDIVNAIGRERLFSTPCYRMDQLPSGGAVLLTQPTPADCTSRIAREAQARAMAHLRNDISYDACLAQLLSRSASLRPVVPSFDPDVREFLELTLPNFGPAERSKWISELNQYHPPPVRELLSISERLEPDVQDIEETIATYGDLHAEKLVALLHKQIASVAKHDPKVLPELDYHFWNLNYPESFRREDIEGDLVPAIGAYVGDLLVIHLGGKWLPRRKLDESQVVLGDRTFLPFLRARHYMQSRQSVIDYSLSQFYRTANRAE